nr:hypothetical protein CFP56_29861 [Quercus suber]
MIATLTRRHEVYWTLTGDNAMPIVLVVSPPIRGRGVTNLASRTPRHLRVIITQQWNHHMGYAPQAQCNIDLLYDIYEATADEHCIRLPVIPSPAANYERGLCSAAQVVFRHSNVPSCATLSADANTEPARGRGQSFRQQRSLDSLQLRLLAGRLRAQGRPDLVHAPSLLSVELQAAQRPHDLGAGLRHPLVRLQGRGPRGHGVDVVGDLVTVGVERQVVDVLPERVLELVPDLRQPENHVAGEDGAGDRDPAEQAHELDRKHEHVRPRDLRDGDGVRDRQRRVDDALDAGQDLAQPAEQRHRLPLVAADDERLVLEDGFEVGGQIRENLQRCVAEVVFGAFDELARVRLGEREPEVLADGLPARQIPLSQVLLIGFVGQGLEVGDQRLQVRVLDRRLESQAVLQRDCKSVEEIHGGEFGQEI